MIERLHRLLTSEADALVAAGNFTIVLLLIILGAALSHQLITRTYKSDLRVILMGLLMEVGGWTMHRLYYGTLRFWREQGLEIDHLRWDTYFPIFFTCIIIMGLVLMLSPVVKHMTGWKCHPCWMIMGSVALYWTVFVGVKLL